MGIQDSYSKDRRTQAIINYGEKCLLLLDNTLLLTEKFLQENAAVEQANLDSNENNWKELRTQLIKTTQTFLKSLHRSSFFCIHSDYLKKQILLLKKINAFMQQLQNEEENYVKFSLITPTLIDQVKEELQRPHQRIFHTRTIASAAVISPLGIACIGIGAAIIAASGGTAGLLFILIGLTVLAIAGYNAYDARKDFQETKKHIAHTQQACDPFKATVINYNQAAGYPSPDNSLPY